MTEPRLILGLRANNDIALSPVFWQRVADLLTGNHVEWEVADLIVRSLNTSASTAGFDESGRMIVRVDRVHAKMIAPILCRIRDEVAPGG